MILILGVVVLGTEVSWLNDQLGVVEVELAVTIIFVYRAVHCDSSLTSVQG